MHLLVHVAIYIPSGIFGIRKGAIVANIRGGAKKRGQCILLLVSFKRLDQM